MAITDELTSLYTRRYFHQSIEFLANLQNKPFSLIMMDIDHFKKFNDTYGHSCGDKVLVLVSELMQKSLRDNDIAFRIGGEEFAILCPGQNANDAKIPAERLRRSISEYKISLASGEEISVTVSMGIAEYPQNSNEINNLFELADKSLYHSKEHGRNRITLYSEIETAEKTNSAENTGT
jgi:diguanylate cyclase (GGDEF)-like protein